MNSLCLNLDRNAIDIMSKYTLKIDDVFIILCLDSNLDLLEEYLRGKTVDQKITVLQPLVRKLIITRAPGEFDLKHYALTQEGLAIATKLKLTNGLSTQQPTPVERTDIDELVEEYLELFPKGVKNGGNKILRSNHRDTAAKIRRFQIKYGYSKDIILRATKNFINRLRGTYTYCPTAEYFVMKDGSSALATECDMIKDIGSDEDIINPFERRM